MDDDDERPSPSVDEPFPRVKHKQARSRDQSIHAIHADRHDIDWTQDSISGLFERLPVTIQQGGNENELSVQINVAMLPPVEDFRGYEAAQPGTAHYLMKAADEQRHHRFKIESEIVSRSERRRDIGQFISGALALTGLVGAIRPAR